MSIPSRRGPKPLSEILGELFTARGYGQFRARAELELAWAAAVGDAVCRQTELGEVRRGVLNVTVGHSALLEELSAFGKPKILAALRAGAPGTTIHDIRFRVGTLGVANTVTPAAEGRSKTVKPGNAAMKPPEAGSRDGTNMASRRGVRRVSRNQTDGENEGSDAGFSQS
jgi:Dna[CI] antecedent, DciA